MNFLSGRGAEELTVYDWNTKVSAPFMILSTSENYGQTITIKSWLNKNLILYDFLIQEGLCPGFEFAMKGSELLGVGPLQKALVRQWLQFKVGRSTNF